MKTAQHTKSAELNIDQHIELTVKLWKHWMRNFENLLEKLQKCNARPLMKLADFVKRQLLRQKQTFETLVPCCY